MWPLTRSTMLAIKRRARSRGLLLRAAGNSRTYRPLQSLEKGSRKRRRKINLLRGPDSSVRRKLEAVKRKLKLLDLDKTFSTISALNLRVKTKTRALLMAGKNKKRRTTKSLPLKSVKTKDESTRTRAASAPRTKAWTSRTSKTASRWSTIAIRKEGSTGSWPARETRTASSREMRPLSPPRSREVVRSATLEMIAIERL